ncbi:hypothetical protein [Gallibacterium genomosp. 1]|uniref:Uncharacterized protein n=1 Tax=Gallibacterium genomosp. 1 TaxID=155515 RepID=A0A0A2XVN0_9PAST|nr:hypothetical protein [Gallibacterium genomosp. 1]KGQ36476.1 hypothetical protein JP36_10120 [Gallibacterium genomosp. 1]
MKCKCPACGAVLSLDVLLQHEQASLAVMNALSLNGEFGRLAVQYLALFRPEKSALTMDRLAKLLSELVSEVQTGQFYRNGQSYNAPLECWIDGLTIVLNSRHNIKRPLTSHGYLYEVMTKWQPKNSNNMMNGQINNQSASRPFSSKTGKALQNLAEFANG